MKKLFCALLIFTFTFSTSSCINDEEYTDLEVLTPEEDESSSKNPIEYGQRQ
ncbi:hypothetical protein FK220_002420 [Flavobacteriaceae bacterium TP-CH-4]|uniref:Secreted protein n=1 Tax=Pelagihabitans pacificus TaxID=2696054 RepID=A0A967AQ69_9FLAO|nr:hypothetical protein [Pelagihabitans pacificus]NHF58179.1 hypothetical protein [Pelagihabitans pacificus]